MLKTIIEVFISVFFVFGLYCAATEIGRLAVRIITSHSNKNNKNDKIDKSVNKDYNTDIRKDQ